MDQGGQDQRGQSRLIHQRFRYRQPGPDQTALTPLTALLLGAALVLAGCASAPQTMQWRATADARAGIELTAVPFHPQELYQCGPASLATVLQWSGVAVTPDELVPQVYVPARRGSFQAEMLAAARRHGRAPHVLAPELDALIAELTAGHPVLVLQNLALRRYPRWHYAVVVGFDPGRGELILRSGTTERRRMPLALFERTWSRGAHWAVVVPAPGQAPASAAEHDWLEAIIALERAGHPEPAAEAWRAATARWPGSAGAWIGLGNNRFHDGDYAGAADAFRALLAGHPGHAAGHNNLAWTLARMGHLAQAEIHAEQAIASDPENTAYRETLAGIRRERSL
jgi:hypothetical protein